MTPDTTTKRALFEEQVYDELGMRNESDLVLLVDTSTLNVELGDREKSATGLGVYPNGIDVYPIEQFLMPDGDIKFDAVADLADNYIFIR